MGKIEIPEDLLPDKNLKDFANCMMLCCVKQKAQHQLI